VITSTDGLSARELHRALTSLLTGSPYVTAPGSEAAWIVGHLSGRSWAQLLAGTGTPLPPDVSAQAEAIALRRRAGEPLQYLLGDAYFYGHRFLADRRVLIPRPETELLVSVCAERLRDRRAPVFADIATGSGCIAISVVLELPHARGVATDLSASALEVALKNARLHGVEDRVEFRQGHLFEPLKGLLFDALLINPPYIPSGDIASLGPELAAEPVMALDGGPDGLDFYRAIARHWRDALFPGGFMACEVGAGQMPEVLRLMGPGRYRVVPDLSGVARALVAERGAVR